MGGVVEGVESTISTSDTRWRGGAANEARDPPVLQVMTA